MKHERRVERGRGALSCRSSRFLDCSSKPFDDGWDDTEDNHGTPTRVQPLSFRRIINYNQSPDIGSGRTINPYRGCEHGCIYCFARPTHAYLDLSPGLDFERRIFYKPAAAAGLEREFAERRYQCRPIMLGPNTDAWQPAEREFGVTRSILEVFARCRHPVLLITKSALIERDLDLLAPMARDNLVDVCVSITTLDRQLSRRMEPRAAAPRRRLKTIAALAAAGVPVSVLAAPMIPALNDHELERVLEAAYEAGARQAGYILLRLPHELKDLFSEWLHQHYPDRAERVLNRMRDCRGGKLYESDYGVRMKGRGEYADLLGRRFGNAYRKLGFCKPPPLDCSKFTRPFLPGSQAELFSDAW